MFISDAGKSQDVTYSSIELKNVGRKGESSKYMQCRKFLKKFKKVLACSDKKECIYLFILRTPLIILTGKHHEPVESSVYSDLKIGTAGTVVLIVCIEMFHIVTLDDIMHAVELISVTLGRYHSPPIGVATVGNLTHICRAI